MLLASAPLSASFDLSENSSSGVHVKDFQYGPPVPPPWGNGGANGGG